MKITLKRFAEDPKHLIRKSPLIIIVNREPSYAIIPYAVYKAKYEEPLHIPGVPQQKPHGRLWRLLFT